MGSAEGFPARRAPAPPPGPDNSPLFLSSSPPHQLFIKSEPLELCCFRSRPDPRDLANLPQLPLLSLSLLGSETSPVVHRSCWFVTNLRFCLLELFHFIIFAFNKTLEMRAFFLRFPSGSELKWIQTQMEAHAALHLPHSRRDGIMFTDWK